MNLSFAREEKKKNRFEQLLLFIWSVRWNERDVRGIFLSQNPVEKFWCKTESNSVLILCG